MKLSIRAQLITFTVCLIILVGSSISIYSIYQGQKRQMEVFVKDSLDSTKVIALTIMDALYAFKVSTLRDRLQSTRINPDILFTYVTDTEGLVLADGTEANPYRDQKLGDTFFVQVMKAEQWIYQKDDNILKIGGPVLLVDDHLGYLMVYYSLDRIFENMNQTTKNSLAITAFCITLGIILALILANRYSRPIQMLVRGTERIAEGDLGYKINLKSKDEIGQLANAFNMMTEKLQVTTVSKEYVDNIIQSMVDTLIVVDHNAIIKTANQATLHSLGYEEQELIGQPITIILKAEKKEDLFPERKTAASINGHSITGTETFYFKKDGNQIPILLSISVMHNRQGLIDGFVCVGQDITERKKAENTIKKNNADLVQANKQLQETQAQLVQTAKLASIGELATGVAHELNQPLTYIRNRAQLILMDGVDHLNPKDAYSVFEKIEQGSDRMMNIINHLRNFARQSEVRHQPVNVNIVLDNSLILLHEQFRHRDIQLQKQFATELPRVYGNAQQLEQVFINMLSNARDALDGKDNATVTIQTKMERQADNREMVVVSFIDNGHGISAPELEKIFDPFFSTKEEGKGTGLGLSISYGIVQDHQGQIHVFSTENESTTFEITLPAVSGST